MLPLTVDEMITEVRQQLDETNQTTVSNESLLAALNRGQTTGIDIMCRYYEEPFLEYAALTLVAQQQEYTMPEGIFEDRLQKVEIISTSGIAFECMRISYRDAYSWRSNSKVVAPHVYTIHGRTLTFYPMPTGSYPARIWYVKEPESLVVKQGQVTAIGGTTSLTVDDIGPDVTATGSPLFSNYINIVDAQTGLVKGTYMVTNANPTTNVITVGAPARASVLNHVTSSTLASTVAVDDYVCLVEGTCIPYYRSPLSNFLIQYAVAETRRRLSAEPEKEMAVLKEFESQIKTSWSNREEQTRVKRRSAAWSRQLPWRRYDSY